MNKFFATILGNIIRWIYNKLATGSVEPEKISFYAISIIIMTLLVTLITIPMTISQQKQSKKMQALGPKMEELQKKYSYDPQILQQQTAKLYKEEGVNSMGTSCLMMIIQLIILTGLYNVIKFPDVYFFKEGFEHINTNFYRVKDLTSIDPLRYGLPFLTSLFQLLEQLLNMKINPAGNMNQSQSQMMNMMLLMPVIFYFTFRQMPAGLGLYRTSMSIIRLVITLITYATGKNRR